MRRIVPADAIRTIVRAVREETGRCQFLGWTPGVSRSQLSALSDVGLDYVFASTPWWDGRAIWLVEEYEILHQVAPVIGVAEAPFAQRLATRVGASTSIAHLYRRALRTAAALGNGIQIGRAHV